MKRRLIVSTISVVFSYAISIFLCQYFLFNFLSSSSSFFDPTALILFLSVYLIILFLIIALFLKKEQGFEGKNKIFDFWAIYFLSIIITVILGFVFVQSNNIKEIIYPSLFGMINVLYDYNSIFPILYLFLICLFSASIAWMINKRKKLSSYWIISIFILIVLIINLFFSVFTFYNY